MRTTDDLFGESDSSGQPQARSTTIPQEAGTLRTLFNVLADFSAGRIGDDS
jgi:hypothetical protein